ncbi:elongation factor 1-gamma [Tanacetum coccineum]
MFKLLGCVWRNVAVAVAESSSSKQQAVAFENHYISKLKSALDCLNTYLASNKFLVGNSVTLADIITTCDLIYGFKFLMTKEFTSKFPNVEMYFWEMIKLQNVKKFTREVKQANDVISLSKAMKQESPMGAKPMRKRYRSARKLEEEAKRENPVDSPSMMVLDNPPDKMDLAYWKKLYLEIKTNTSQTIKVLVSYLFLGRGGFLDFAADYSLWFCDDKQNDKNELIATVEKVKAFLLGIDLARDHTFGKILITGSNAACKVNGFWIFQQAQVTNILRDRLKESFKMTQVDTSVEDQKKRVIQMIDSKDIFEDEKILHVFCFM